MNKTIEILLFFFCLGVSVFTWERKSAELYYTIVLDLVGGIESTISNDSCPIGFYKRSQ